MINILYEMIKILHEKMWNTIYLYWFHNNTLAVNNSPNGHSNKLWINKGSPYLMCQVKSPWWSLQPKLAMQLEVEISNDGNCKLFLNKNANVSPIASI